MDQGEYCGMDTDVSSDCGIGSCGDTRCDYGGGPGNEEGPFHKSKMFVCNYPECSYKLICQHCYELGAHQRHRRNWLKLCDV